MDTLYINAKSISASDNELLVDLETLLLVNVFKLCDIGNVQLIVTLTPNIDEPTFKTQVTTLQEATMNEIDEIVTYVKWPALFTQGNCVVAGLCSVARQLIKSSKDENSQFLLGFRESCLAACSESSIWTKFCEVDMVTTVKNVLLEEHPETAAHLPDDLVRFEYHMQQPVRMHNVYKLAREKQKDSSIKSSVPVSALNIPHCYSEGPYLTLADVILAPTVEILLGIYSEAIFKEHLPLTFGWIMKMREYERHSSLNGFTRICPSVGHNNGISIVCNQNIKKESLYSSDPNRYKPTNRIYTKQNDVENALNLVESAEIVIESSLSPFGYEIPFDWSNIPMSLRPEGGALPKKRSKRKEEQLENLVKAVLKVTELAMLKNPGNGLKIVDFCSGSGHLGLLLGYLLPNCEVILVENKEKSLQRALARIHALEMKNVVVLQSNLDYFKAKFDIGVALHACGVATDLVMQSCIENKAHFVCCPCCYGGIHDCYHLKFPRSVAFLKQFQIGDYLNIAHAADQTHDKENVKTAQGYRCMDIIDTDRKLYSESCGYDMLLGKLYPDTCTPKNNLLVGLFKDNL